MSKHQPIVAVLPGMFDPPTNGHVDIIRRGAGLFDELIVAVGDNPDKVGLLDSAARLSILEKVTAGLANVRVKVYRGLTVDFVRECGARAILRGIRNSQDLHFEFQMANTNRCVSGIETVFIMPGPEFAYTSSSLIRQIAQHGGDISSMVPPEVMSFLAMRK